MASGFNLNCGILFGKLLYITLFCLCTHTIAEPEDCKPRRMRELQNVYNPQCVAGIGAHHIESQGSAHV